MDFQLFFVVKTLVVAQLLFRHEVKQLDFFVLMGRFPVGRYYPFLIVLLLFLLQLLSLIRSTLPPRIVIPVEELLEFGFTQKQRIFLNKLRLLFVFYCYLFILVEVALLHHRDEGRFDFLRLEFLPVETS